MRHSQSQHVEFRLSGKPAEDPVASDQTTDPQLSVRLKNGCQTKEGSVTASHPLSVLCYPAQGTKAIRNKGG